MRLRWLGVGVVLLAIVLAISRRTGDEGSAAEAGMQVDGRVSLPLETKQAEEFRSAPEGEASHRNRTLLIRGSASLHVSTRELAAIPEGTLRFTLEDAAGNRRSLSVPVQTSSWQAVVNEGDTLLVDSIDVAGRVARPVRREPIVDLTSEIRLVFLWDDAIVLSVLDADSLEPLDEVALLVVPSTAGAFDYPGLDLVPNVGPSPVSVTRERYSTTCWLGARGFAWTAVVLEPANNNRTILLSRGADLDVVLESVEPTDRAWIEVAEADGERRLLWRVLEAGSETEWRLRGLPRSRLVVRGGRSETELARARRAPDVEVEGSHGGLHLARVQLDGADAACGSLAVEVLLPPGQPSAKRIALLVREPRPDGSFDTTSAPIAKHSEALSVRSTEGSRLRHGFGCLRPALVQVEVSPFGHMELAQVRAGEETRLEIDLRRPFVLEVSVWDATSRKLLPGALVVFRSLDAPEPSGWTQSTRSKSGRSHFETTATRVEVCASLLGRNSVSRIVTLGSLPTDLKLELERAQPIEVVVQLREGEEPVAVSSSIWGKLTGKRLDGDGELSSFELKLASAPRERGERAEHSCSAVLATFSFPGKYKLELDGVPGFERCEVECELATSTGSVTLQLVRERR